MSSNRFSWLAVVGIGLAGLVAMSAATALAARSAASTFELVLQGRYEALFDGRLVATFTSGAPFCESGAAADVPHPRGTQPPAKGGMTVRRYTCGDGSGSLTLETRNEEAAWDGGLGEWTIVEGTDRYAGLRGKGIFSHELLSGNPWDFAMPVEFRTRSEGFADVDVVAPSLAFTSATAAKLRRPAGAYALRIAIALRDDVPDNPVSYTLTASAGGVERARRVGTATGAISMKLRIRYIRPPAGAPVLLVLSGSDPVGNEVSIAGSLKLPR